MRFGAERRVGPSNEVIGGGTTTRGTVDIYQVLGAHDGLCILRRGGVHEASKVARGGVAAAEVVSGPGQAAVFRTLLIGGIALGQCPWAGGVGVGLLLFSVLEADDEGVHDETAGSVATRRDLGLALVLVVDQGRLRLPVDVLLCGLLGGLGSRVLVSVAPGDGRGLNVQVDTAQASQDADVVRAVVGAGCVVIRLIGLVIQLFLHVRIQQVEVVDVIDLDLRRQGRSVAQQYGSTGGRRPSGTGLGARTRSRAHILLVAEVDCPRKVVAETEVLVLGADTAFVPFLVPLLGQPRVEPVVGDDDVVFVVLVGEGPHILLVDLDGLLFVRIQSLECARHLRLQRASTACVSIPVPVPGLLHLRPRGGALVLVIFLGHLCGVLGQDANGVVGLLYDGNLGEDPGLELPLLLVVGPLLDVFDLEPLVVEQVLGSGPGVVVDVEASLEDIEVLARDLLVVDVVGAPLDPPVEVVVSLASEGEAAVQEGVEQHSCGPDICRWAGVLDLGDDLGRHVGRRAAEHPDLLMIRDASREAEVDELHVLVLVEENVLQLDVSVGYALAVAVLQCHQDLAEDATGLLLIELLVDHLFEVGVQASPGDVLHDQVDV